MTALGRGDLIPADPAREERELREYLGESFRLDRLRGHARLVDDELGRCGDEGAFYRESDAYLYDLTAFAMSGVKQPYLRDLVALRPPPARLLDYGCGIGSDGLRLLEAGYDVAFADFDNPSTRYLRWRLEQRGRAADVFDLDAPGGPPGGFDAAFAFDVAEHVPDPFALLAELESRAALVVVNLLEPVAGETSLHHPLPVGALLAHIRDQRLRRYRRYHRRSHLVAYRPGAAAGARARVRAAAAWWAGRALSRARRAAL